MPIRNGRFKGERTIIRGRANVFFRILNSGEFHTDTPDKNAFKVTFGAGDANTVVVRPTFSVDIKVGSTAHDVSVAAVTSGEQVEGIYEVLPNPEFKSGRFKTKGAMDASQGVVIITPGAGSVTAVYRVFNSGPVALQLMEKTPGGAPADFGDAIAEDQSYDFVTSPNKIVLVRGTGAATAHIEGMYDLVSMT